MKVVKYSEWYKICPRCGNPYGASQFPSKDENGKDIYVCSNCNLIETVYKPLVKQLEDQNDRLIKERDDANLKLAEKEERIEIARNVKQARIDSLELDKKICEEHKQVIFNHLLEKCKNHQDKIFFAVEQLEKTKKNIVEDTVWELTCEDAVRIIDKQIKQLKEGK